MEVSINITLSQEDIDRGLTASDAVYAAFPPGTLKKQFVAAEGWQATPVEVELDDTLGEALLDEIEQEAAEDTNIAKFERTVTAGEFVDSAGVPWNAEIHSSNKSKYKEGSPQAGRWQWRKGSNKDTREVVAQQLAAGLKSTSPEEAVQQPGSDLPGTGGHDDVLPADAPPNSNVSTVVAIPTAENAAPPVASGPVPENSGEQPAQTGTTGTITWPEFVKAVKANGLSIDQVNEAAASHGVEKMALLSPGETNPKRDEVARTLGFTV